MPIQLKQAAINFKDNSGYNNVGAFFLGDITGEALEWLDNNAPLGYVTPELFGAAGDGVTDDTQAWKDAIDSGAIIVAVNQYLCSEPLYLDNDTYIYGKIINNTTDGVKISGKGSGHIYVVNVYASREDSTKHFVGLEVINSNGCAIRCQTTNFYVGLKLTGDENHGCCYNHIDSCYTTNSKYSIYISTKNSGWCNENYFYNMRNINWTDTQYHGLNYGITLDKEVTATNGINSNHFYNMCFEGSYCAVNILNGLNNTFENVRTEGCTYAAIFATNSNYNIVRVSHTKSNIDDGNNLVVSNQDIVNLFKS